MTHFLTKSIRKFIGSNLIFPIYIIAPINTEALSIVSREFCPSQEVFWISIRYILTNFCQIFVS